jgi:hypothetical protein
MQPTSRLGTPPNDTRTTMKLRMLIADLGRQAQLLTYDLQEEEKRTGSFDVSNIAYPTLARNLRARRDNLLITIAMLESQLAGTAIAA